MAPAQKPTAFAHPFPKLSNPCGKTRKMQKSLEDSAHKSFLDFLKADTCDFFSVYQEKQAIEGLVRLRLCQTKLK